MKNELINNILYDVFPVSNRSAVTSSKDHYVIAHPDLTNKAFVLRHEIRNRLQTMLKCLRDNPEMYGEDEVEANDFVISMILTMFVSENRRKT